MHIFHKWEIKKTRGVDYFHEDNPELITRHATNLLMQCNKCGKVKVKEIAGSWELKDFNKGITF